MARTFTGLKLQGQLGKFGHIEISDISAYVELPDGKVMSGTEWGNFLLWDGGFIKVELSKRGKKFCHNVRSLIEHDPLKTCHMFVTCRLAMQQWLYV